MSTPRTNRLRRAVLGLPGQDLNPTRGGVGSDLQWVGGLPVGTSNAATPGQMGAGRQSSRAGGAPVGAAISSISESGSGCPSNSSNPAALDPSMRFSVPEREQNLTRQSSPPNTGMANPPFIKLMNGHSED